MRILLRCLALILMLSQGAAAATSAVRPRTQPNPFVQGRALLEAGDYLGFRVFLKKVYWKKISYGEWYALRSLVNSEASKVGFDLISIWNQRNPSGKSAVDNALDAADALMFERKFAEAFAEYQKAAWALKRNRAQLQMGNGAKLYAQRIRDLNSLLPFVYQSMGRALYGAERFEEALQVYFWIHPSYPRYRQVLFERMWTAFKAGKVEVALGAIASQRSHYFSRYLSPESYLIQTYIYRKLCRMEDLDHVVQEMRNYEETLAKGGAADWAGTDIEARVLWGLSTAEVQDIHPTWVSRAEREKEKREIRAALEKAFERQRPKLLRDLKTATAYAHLAGVVQGAAALKPIEKLTSREALLALDLEIWPADSTEEWADEIGTHQFIGDSLCGTKTDS